MPKEKSGSALKSKTFYSVLLKYQKKINSQFNFFFNEKIKESFLISQEAVKTIKILKDYALGEGKRLRPILIIIGYLLAGGKNKKEILKTSLSVELIHNFFLIHDDIIDEDKLRRGQPSLHYFYQKKFGDNHHTGISLAMVGGDITNALGYEILIKSRFLEKHKIKAIKILNETVEKTCHGEMGELLLKKREFSERDILKIYEHKTAYYTFVNPLKIGAVLAGQSEKFLDKLEKFALPMGIAFQIQDDILGLFGSQKEIGKPIGSDIKENQPNLLIFKTLALADYKNKRKFRKYLGQSKTTKKDINKIREIVKESGALKYSREKSENLIKKAKYSLEEMEMPGKEKHFLLDLSDYIIIRNY